MKFRLIPIPAPLTEDVACIRLAEYSGEEELAIKVCLNGMPGIVFQHHEGRSPVETITTRSSAAASIPILYAYGQMTNPGVMKHRRMPFTTMQVVLKPHALQSLLGIDAAELTNGVVDLAEFSAGDLQPRLLEAHNETERVALLTDFLLARRKQEPARDQLIEEGLRLIHARMGAMSVKGLLECLSISERQFEKRFRQAVGVTPYFYMRVKRFNGAIHLMRTRQFQNLTDVAHALNFYDQSHFIRDIKAFSDLTPTDLSQKVDDFLPDQPINAYV